MELPIYLGGERAGRLSIRASGLYTLICADCEEREGLHRLWLCGEGRRVYFGLLTPQNGRLTLCRRYSRAELRALPRRISYAADGEPVEAAPPRKEPHAPPAEWTPMPGGKLYRREGETALLALPVLPGVFEKSLRIGGREYLVFRCDLRYTVNKFKST